MRRSERSGWSSQTPAQASPHQAAARAQLRKVVVTLEQPGRRLLPLLLVVLELPVFMLTEEDVVRAPASHGVAKTTFRHFFSVRNLGITFACQR